MVSGGGGGGDGSSALFGVVGRGSAGEEVAADLIPNTYTNFGGPAVLNPMINAPAPAPFQATGGFYGSNNVATIIGGGTGSQMDGVVINPMGPLATALGAGIIAGADVGSSSHYGGYVTGAPASGELRADGSNSGQYQIYYDGDDKIIALD